MPAVQSRTMGAAKPATSVPAPGKNHNKKPTDEMKALAVTHFTENKVANAAKGKSDKARKSLYQTMDEMGLDRFPLDFQGPEGKISLVAYVNTPEGTQVDVRALYKIMDCNKDPKQLAKFFEIVSATQKSVVDALGSAVYTKVSTPKIGEPNVTVTTPDKVK